MNYFYFNECLGEGHSLQSITSNLEKAIIGFVHLENPRENMLILEKVPSDINLSGHSLQEIVKSLKNRDVKKKVFEMLKNYPIEPFVDTHSKVDDVELLEKEYQFLGKDATNLAIAYYCDWFIFSLPLLKELEVNKIVINSLSASNTLSINNFYGENISYTNKAIRELVFVKSGGIEKLKLLSKEVIILPEFEKSFKSVSLRDQNLIIDRFLYAKNEGIVLTLNNKHKDQVVKHVRPCVEELRIVNPIDIRVYFHQVGTHKLIVAGMNYKNNNDQTNDINNAELLIKRYLGK